VAQFTGVTLTRSQAVRLLDAHGVHPSRALGQNFVVDPNTVRRIARLAGVGSGDQVVEIGAGLGSLTLALAETGAQVTAVEIDARLVGALRQVTASTGVRVVQGDALQIAWESVVGSERDRWVLVANLPYNVATPLVIRLLEEVPAIARMLVMVQLEVAERLVAHVGNKAYGAVSVKVAYWASASIVGKIPRAVFLPKPNVESALVSVTRRAAPGLDPSLVAYDRFGAVVRAGFAHRRKTLRRSLDGVVDLAAFDAAGVSPRARAEELDLDAWGRLAGWTPNTPSPS
jgi:16S rRNA (adenine1518-N6/adenine1519-N6)-dimethyltransferase